MRSCDVNVTLDVHSDVNVHLDAEFRRERACGCGVPTSPCTWMRSCDVNVALDVRCDVNVPLEAGVRRACAPTAVRAIVSAL